MLTQSIYMRGANVMKIDLLEMGGANRMIFPKDYFFGFREDPKMDISNKTSL